jgi:hypothetical protein
MHNYVLTVKHDRGIVHIHTTADSADGARQIVMAAERCPERAIRRVRAYDADGFELDARGQRKTIAGATVNMHESFSKNGQSRPDKVPTRWEIQLPGDVRWRRVYSTRHSGLRYITLDGLKVVVSLPEAL